MSLWVRRGTAFLGLSLAGLSLSASAHAEPAQRERVAARALFDTARRLMARKNYAEACPKLEESQRLDPGIGTQFNLAECLEHTGKLASAWNNFLDVMNAAKASGQTAREDAARARAAALEDKVSKMTIIADTSSGQLTVKRDGVALEPSLWGTPIPVDPGDHVVSAAAPGKKVWQTSVVVKEDASMVTVSVPVLEDVNPRPQVEPSPSPPPPLPPPPPPIVAPEPLRLPPPPPPPSGWSRVPSLLLGGVGVAGLTVGTVFAIQANAKNKESLKHCRGEAPNLCDNTGVDIRNEAIALGNGSTVAFIVGGASLATGIVLWFLIPGSTASPSGGAKGALRTTPERWFSVGATVDSGQPALRFRGSF